MAWCFRVRSASGGGLSRRFRHGAEQIRGRIYSNRRKLSQVGRVDSSVVRVLARYARGPWFESRSGRVLFPCDKDVSYSKGYLM